MAANQEEDERIERYVAEVADLLEQSMGDEAALRGLFLPLAVGLDQMKKEHFRRYWVPRGQDLILQVLREEHDENIHVHCWAICTKAFRLTPHASDNPDPEDLEVVYKLIDDGLLECMVVEMDRNPSRLNALSYCLIAATNVCLYARVIDAIVRHDIPRRLLSFIQSTDIDFRIRSLAIIAVTNLALFPSVHENLLYHGALEMAISLLGYLRSDIIVELDLGLTAAFLICRIAGSDEAGRGMQSIQENRELTEKLHWILDQVLDAGPAGIVLGSHWNPANIVLDISILAQSDQNKHLLRDMIPLIHRCMVDYGDSNRRLMKYAVATLVELYRQPECREEILNLRNEFLEELRKPRPYRPDITTFQETQMLAIMLAKPPNWSISSVLRRVGGRVRDGLPAMPSMFPTSDW